MALAAQLLKIFKVLVANVFNIFLTLLLICLVDVLLDFHHKSIFQRVPAFFLGLNPVFLQVF